MSEPLQAADFPIRTHDKVRYADTDRQGHVNNASFSTFLETGRVEILYDPTQPLAAKGAPFVIVRLALDFRAEIHWPGNVEIGTRLVRVGRSSVTLAQAVFQDSRCVATAETVIVQVDDASGTARVIDDAARTRLESLQA